MVYHLSKLPVLAAVCVGLGLLLPSVHGQVTDVLPPLRLKNPTPTGNDKCYAGVIDTVYQFAYYR